MSQWSSSLPQNMQLHAGTPSKLHTGSFAMSKSTGVRRAQFDMDNMIGSPFYLTTVSIAIVGWFIAFFASIAANVHNHNFSHFAWWAILYQLCVIVGICTAILYGAADSYKLAICAFLASALSFTSSTANALIYSSSGAQEAAAAGHIFLSIVNILWILYFGSDRDASPHAWVDSYSLDKGPSVPGGPRPMSNANGLYPSGRYGTPYPKSVVDGDLHNSMATGALSPGHAQGDLTHTKTNRDTMATTTTSVSPIDSDYLYRAKAIYSYDASPEDPNEISFTKGDILEIAGMSWTCQTILFV